MVGYREAVLETFPHERRLFQRLNLLIKHYPGSLWSNEQHERRIIDGMRWCDQVTYEQQLQTALKEEGVDL